MALISDLPNATPQKSDLIEIQNGQISSNNSSVSQLMQLSASENLAPAYDANAGVYAVGDFVTQDGTLYQCNTAIATPEAFDATKWDAVKVTEISSGVSVIQLTQAEYDALEQAGELQEDTQYYITDGTGGESDLIDDEVVTTHKTWSSDHILSLLPKIVVPKSAVATFNTALAMPLKSCTSLISGYQEGSGTPSPDNVRPLHAFSSGSLGKCDNNTASLWTIDNSFNGDVEFNQLIPTENKDYTNNYTDTRENLALQIISITSPAQSYIYQTVTSVGKLNLMFKPSTVTQGLRIKHNGASRDLLIYNSIAETLSANHVYLVDVVCDGINPTVVGGIDLRNLQFFDLTQMFDSPIADYIYNLETQTAGAGVAFFKALYPNDYYPYNAGTKQLVGDTLAIFTFGQTIYQGSIDWMRGVVTATWGYIASYNGETLTGEWLCNKAPYEAGTTPPTGSQVAYELATPIEIPLGGINLLTQEGQNNIFCDTGDIDLTYYEDVQKYIDDKIAETQALILD